MKKYLLLLLFIPLFNCSDGEEIIDNVPDPNYLLCISDTNEYISGSYEGAEVTNTYTYSENKLISATLEGVVLSNGVLVNNQNFYIDYTYSDDLLISVNRTEDLIGASGLNPLSNTEDYEYSNDGLLIKKTITMYDNGDITNIYEYFYSWSNNNLTRQMTDSDGNIVKIMTFDSNNNILEYQLYHLGELINQHTYNYDYSKNSAFSNSISYVFSEDYPKGMNPLLSIYFLASDRTYNYENTYDDNGYILSYLRTSSTDANNLRRRTYTYN